MNIIIGIVLLAHGLAHMVPRMTTVFGGHVGEPWMRVVGTLWAMVGLAFAFAAVAAVWRIQWWPRYAAVVAMASLVLCAAGAPETRIGTIVNFAIIIAVAVFVRWPWRAHVS